MKIVIDPLANIYYSSFYIEGLNEKFGKRNIVFRSKPFLEIENREANFNFIVSKNECEQKYSIHFDDNFNIKKELYDWCDVYGNVNANFEETPPEFHPKLVSLAPSFGIRLWGLSQTSYRASCNLIKSGKLVDFRKYFGKYKRQWKLRLPYKYYFPNNIRNQSNPYIFHLSTLWYNDEWNKNDEGVNNTRANFIKACKSIPEVHFAGGLVPMENKIINSKFIPFIFNESISMIEYLHNVKKSAVVFNTPAFWSCHGWKLGEYLALGKAIISTPLSNDLPNPLVHGENIHIVENNIEDFKKAVILLINNEDYKRKLEAGAREYWEKYGTPVKSLELLGL